MIDQANLGEVDRLCRYLDIPFDLDKWTMLYKTHKDHTLTAYFNLIADDHHFSPCFQLILQIITFIFPQFVFNWFKSRRHKY